jgi:C-terminal processing protease CtpA/Prc
VRCGDRTFPTGTRAVDPLFRRNLLDHYLKCEAAGNNALAGRTDDGIGYLLVGEWSQRLDLRAIDKALAAMRDCKALVIDARANSGGDEKLALHVAAWFVEGTRTYARSRYRTKPGKEGFGPVLDRSIRGNADAEGRFLGPIAVLTSRYVMSSNESFVMMLQQSKDCTLVGQPTFGSSGNPKPFDLGNGVTLVLPTWQDLRLDGTCIEGEGIAPDVLVECTAEMLQQQDPILERALDLLRKKLAK